MAYVLIATGAVMFLLSFLGYCGAIRESPCMLTMVIIKSRFSFNIYSLALYFLCSLWFILLRLAKLKSLLKFFYKNRLKFNSLSFKMLLNLSLTETKRLITERKKQSRQQFVNALNSSSFPLIPI